MICQCGGSLFGATPAPAVSDETFACSCAVADIASLYVLGLLNMPGRSAAAVRQPQAPHNSQMWSMQPSVCCFAVLAAQLCLSVNSSACCLPAVVRRGMGVLHATNGSLRAVACPANFYGAYLTYNSAQPSA
jgi:hypothetical protein